MAQSNRIECKNVALSRFPIESSKCWKEASKLSLLENTKGKKPRFSSNVYIFRSDKQRLLYLKFECVDDEVISTFRNNNEPIYMQDVLECFITKDSSVNSYIELEVSPYNVSFGGKISYEGKNRVLDMSISMKGFESKTKFFKEDKRLVSIWALPYDMLDISDAENLGLKANFFRIDHSNGSFELQAWQPTLCDSFHVREYFGYIDFV